MRIGIVFSFVLLLFFACSTEEKSPQKLFQQLPSSRTGIDFVNQVENTEDFNIFSYRNFYNGGGVAIGDVNKDGLADVYFTNNMGKNKLYLNKGDFQFEDISESAGVEGSKGWSTGVVMVDINGDDWLDIYVCNAGYVAGDDQQNELFINQGDGLGFVESAAEYQLNEGGYTTHAAFFDYDLDGDLDCYILNNSFMPVNTLNYSNKRELNAKDWPVKDFLKGGGDKLLRNDGGVFNDVSEEAGIYSSLIGFGLGVTVGDVNGDLLPDLYVSNDFFERDYLYINQGDGSFREDIKNWMEHLSLASMGTDMADLNNDGYPEIFATEMLPETDHRRKLITSFENYNTYYLKLKRDFYHQYMHNTLQFNNKDQTFSEIAWYSGVAASDWSWGALLFDADNDGHRDIYVCNGVYQDVTDQDFINFFANEVTQQMALTGEKKEIEAIIERMPSRPQLNKLFHNNKDLTFSDKGVEWGFEEASFSNGAAYGDLDNDGDLDLVVNNLNQQAFVYRNQSENLFDHHYLSVALQGSKDNPRAVGAQVFLYRGAEILNTQLIPSRGFQSSVDYRLTFGLGTQAQIDSLLVIWPDQSRYFLPSPPVDTLLEISQKASEQQASMEAKSQGSRPVTNAFVQSVDNDFPQHAEDEFIDFFQEGLTIRMLSREGPQAAAGDVNGDGLEDVYIGGAFGQPGQLYLQKAGKFVSLAVEDFQRMSNFEDTAIRFFDADGDGDLDLYVGSGGNNRPAGSQSMQDRFYVNQGGGKFTFNPRALPKNGYNTSVVLPFDMDNDGDLDLFVGSRSIPNVYGAPPRHFLYENDGSGAFTDVLTRQAPTLNSIGMLTDAQLANVYGDERPELVVVGEWMSPSIWTQTQNGWEQVKSNLSDYKGWWYALEATDLDGDGDLDFVLGNRGENFYFSGTADAPAKLWLNDFDQNGTVEKIITQSIDGKDMPIPLKKELTGQLVSLKKQNLKHSEYAKKSIQDLFAPEVLERSLMREATYFRSAVALNDGDGQFRLLELPREVQFSCVCDIYCTDANRDGQTDILLAGNDAGFMPQFSKLDASFGHLLLNKGEGQFERVENRDSGFFVRGDVKQLLPITIDGTAHLLSLINRQKPQLFKVSE
ncbi:MAG: FG-GAP-like repeat-containing protein [Bacteroidota bacterium]